MRILVTDGMDKTAMAELKAQGHEVVEQFYEPAELGKALRDFDVVVVRSKTKVRAAQIDEAKGSQLKLIIRGGVGVDNIDVDYAKAAGIDVKNTPRASSESVAELAMAHMFSCARYISHAGYTMRNGQWEKKAYGKGIELCGKTLGVVGFGRIGQHLGVMAKAIGMTDIAIDIFHIPGIEEQLGIPYVEMDELLAKADFISVHAPAVDGGALINAENIAKMKDGVCIINTSRGTNVDEDALLAALESGKLRKYMTDLADENLINKPGIVSTPHLGASTKEAEDNCASMAVDELMDYIENGNIRNSVNFPPVSLDAEAGTTRVGILYKGEVDVTALLNEAVGADKVVKVEIGKSRTEYGYALALVKEDACKDCLAGIKADGVIKVRVL